jgi:putative CocE/NonD family hydrolase
MRDGVRLSTSIFLPSGDGKYPAVLVRTAYNRVGAYYGLYFAERGIAYVVQDCRGRYDSEGEFYPFINEPNDGEDTLNWIGSQPWCNGKIGMFGDSYLAATQFAVGPLKNKYLACLNPRFMSVDCWKRAYYCSGAFSLGLTWSWLCFECNSRTSEAAMMPAFDVSGVLCSLPLATLDEVSGAGIVQSYRDYVSHNTYSKFWQHLNQGEKYRDYTVPVFLLGGWYDYYPADAVSAFIGLRENAPSKELHDAHRLLIGPWTHGTSNSTMLGEIDFGPDALKENDASERWLECLLKGKKPEQFQKAPVRIFVMGANLWRDQYEWPPAGTEYKKIYLRSGNSLSTVQPSSEKPDYYQYDPADPVPTYGGNHSIGTYNPGLYEIAKPGPYDQRPIEARKDVLTYTSDPLDKDVEITGHVIVKLFAASSARDTDFVARLTDVHPDGKSINITEGVIRARFRENIHGAPKLIEPGKVYEYTIDLGVTSNLFKKGHAIRLQITSSNFPLWDRNLNTGNNPATDTEMLTAQQTIFHDTAHPSHIVLPVVRGSLQ